MPDAFSEARDVLFANEDRATDAAYFESEGDDEGTELRVIVGFAEPNAGFFETDALVPGNKLWVRKTDLPIAPPEGAWFIAGARKLVVRTAVVDGLDKWWICDVDERAIGS